MKLLLDTHALLWWLDDPSLLAAGARDAIADLNNQVFVSAAVIWEISIKKALGKLTAPDDLEEAVDDAGFHPLPVTIAHALGVLSLPDHHRDPFDRMLIAQALHEGCDLVSRDLWARSYPVSILPA